MSKKAKLKILFASANPAMDLNLDNEHRAIMESIQKSSYVGYIDVVPLFACRYDDLTDAMNREKPDIIHFAGHGTGEDGLVFSNPYSNTTITINKDTLQEKEIGIDRVSGEILKDMFATAKDNLKLVVLNACLSEVQAQEIVKKIDFVIGMNNTIKDATATIFAKRFYQSLASDVSIKRSFAQAKTQVKLEAPNETQTPMIFTKDGAKDFKISDIVDRSLSHGGSHTTQTKKEESVFNVNSLPKDPSQDNRYNYALVSIGSTLWTISNQYVELLQYENKITTKFGPCDIRALIQSYIGEYIIEITQAKRYYPILPLTAHNNKEYYVFQNDDFEQISIEYIFPKDIKFTVRFVTELYNAKENKIITKATEPIVLYSDTRSTCYDEYYFSKPIQPKENDKNIPYDLLLYKLLIANNFSTLLASIPLEFITDKFKKDLILVMSNSVGQPTYATKSLEIIIKLKLIELFNYIPNYWKIYTHPHDLPDKIEEIEKVLLSSNSEDIKLPWSQIKANLIDYHIPRLDKLMKKFQFDSGNNKQQIQTKVEVLEKFIQTIENKKGGVKY